MTRGLEHASYSLPEWQAVKVTFFAPCLLKAPQDDYMEVENEQYTEEVAAEQQSVPEQTTQSAADQDKTHGEQWQWQAENEWGRPAYHQEHAGDPGIVNSDLATISYKLKRADIQYLKLQKIFEFAPSAT